MKKALTLLLLAGMAFSAKAQFVFPNFTDSAEKPANTADSPSVKPAVVVQQPNNPAQDALNLEKQQLELEKQKYELNELKRTDKSSIDDSTKRTELEIRKLELQARKFKLEQEIAALKHKDSLRFLSPEEKANLAMKNENLKLILEKEKFYLEKDLEQIRKDARQETYPESVVYGHQFFRDKKFKYFSKTDDLVPTEGYILGTGDVVQLEVWGSRYWSKSYVVSESGSIDLVGYQKLFVKGLTLKQVRSMVGSRLGLGGNESSFSVTVTRPRMVSINIMGEVFNPGTYTLPATNSAFNALVSMGGPSNTGSVRNIYIKRDGKIRDSFDVYEYFKDIYHQQDVYLQNNDYVIVAPLTRYCTIGGSILKPGNYELKKGEGIVDLINFAGGYFPDTYLKDVVITRVNNNKYEVLSINLDSLIRNKGNFKLNGGETVFLKQIVREAVNVISVAGAVSVPGTYRMRQNMKVSDLLKTANGLTNTAFKERGYIVRTNPDNTKSYYAFNPAEVISGKDLKNNIEIADRDSVYIFFKSDFEKFYKVSISGPVYKPMTISYISGQKLSQFIFMAGGLRQEADKQKAYIIRTNFEKDKTIISFNPENILADTGNSDIELMPRDEVVFFQKDEFKKFYQVSISGSVYKPASMDYAAGMKMGDLVKLAGGFRDDIDKTKGFIIRSNTEGDSKIIEFEPGKVVEGNVGYDFLLEPRDAVVVFSRLAYKNTYSVTIEGAVNNPTTIGFAEGMRLGDIVNLAGGLALDADSLKGFIIRTDLDNYRTLIPFIPEKIFESNGMNNIFLGPRDIITIFSKRPYKRYYNMSITGPVKDPKTMSFAENTSVKDFIDLAGGLELWASRERGLIVHTNLQTGYKTIRTFDVDSILNDPFRKDNYVLEENDEIRIFDLSELRNEFLVSIYGEVKRSGDFAYAESLTLQNVIDMAGGLKYISAGTTIEVVRNFYFKNGRYKFLKPEIIFSKIADNLTIKRELQNYTLQPFDRIFVRRNPDFMPLKMIYIDGAVRYPGYYALQSENEKLASIYIRAGGFRTDADKRGIKLKRTRSSGDTMEIVINSRKAIHRRHSKYNVILKEGDFVSVPYAENLVTITGDVNKFSERDLGVFYTAGKRAKYYISNYAGGFTESSDKKNVVVLRANGARVASRRFLFFRVYPLVKPGSKIIVTSKDGTSKTGVKGGAKGKPFDLDIFMSKLLTRMTAVLSIIAIFRIATAK